MAYCAIGAKKKQMRSEKFIQHLKETHPEIDVDRLLEIYDKEMETIAAQAPKDYKVPLDCDLIVAVTFTTIKKYNKENENKDKE